MFTTVASVKKYTDRDVSAALIARAQAIIEIYIGKTEVEIDDSRDLAILDKATAYQAVYMQDNEEIVYEQAALATTSQAGEGVVFKGGDFTAPWIAPLAVLACRFLSSRRARSIRTGKIFQFGPVTAWRRN
jgi:hypothetical protein